MSRSPRRFQSEAVQPFIIVFFLRSIPGFEMACPLHQVFAAILNKAPIQIIVSVFS